MQVVTAGLGKRSCLIFGERYPSISEASRKLDIPHTTLSRYIASGRDGFEFEDPLIILPKGSARHSEPSHIHTPAGAFHSLNEAGIALGIHPTTVYYRIHSKKYPDYHYSL